MIGWLDPASNFKDLFDLFGKILPMVISAYDLITPCRMSLMQYPEMAMVRSDFSPTKVMARSVTIAVRN